MSQDSVIDLMCSLHADLVKDLQEMQKKFIEELSKDVQDTHVVKILAQHQQAMLERVQQYLDTYKDLDKDFVAAETA
jgi:hypothetical protein